ISHTYRHDLESFFYAFIWQCTRRDRGKEQPEGSLLTKWYTDSYRDMASTKRGHMYIDGVEDILEEIPPHFDRVNPLCRELREISRLFVRILEEPKALYGPMIEA
ncbi:hypothetical protein K505DRAFT_196263, partial [Melanomma pulvis-pyrius CBS 109.77]